MPGAKLAYFSPHHWPNRAPKGIGDPGVRQALLTIISLARQPGAIIYTVVLFDETDEDRNPKVLKQIAHETGGETFLPATIKQLVPVCERIARDIRNQHTIAHIPSNKVQDGNYRVIKVKTLSTGGQQLEVRTRAGYFARAHN